MQANHPILKTKLTLQIFRKASSIAGRIKNKNILFYWPHGFGDFVFLATALPFLDPSNKYFITRFGDDNTAIFEGCELITPLYLGVDNCNDGAFAEMKHLGNRGIETDGAIVPLELPHALASACIAHDIEVLFDIPFDETYGCNAFPYHTKARRMLKQFLPEERLRNIDLNRPLPSALNFSVPSAVQNWVDTRLRNGLGLDATKRLCVITRNGYTGVEKNWGHRWRDEMPVAKRHEGEECRDFLRLLRSKSDRWRAVVIEDRIFKGNDTVSDLTLGCLSYAQLFSGSLGGPLPFAWIIKAIMKRAELVIGVPAGPTHLAMAIPHLPVVGIWLAHFPSWYDEPKGCSIHLLGKSICEKEEGKRPGSFLQKGKCEYNVRLLNSKIASGQDVMSAVECLL